MHASPRGSWREFYTLCRRIAFFCFVRHIKSITFYVRLRRGIQYSVFSIRYSVFSIRYSVFGIQYSVFSVQCSVFSLKTTRNSDRGNCRSLSRRHPSDCIMGTATRPHPAAALLCCIQQQFKSHFIIFHRPDRVKDTQASPAAIYNSFVTGLTGRHAKRSQARVGSAGGSSRAFAL